MNATNITHAAQLDPDKAADLATILAALRFYQRAGQGEPDNRDDYIQEIATNGGDVTSLDADGIDDLCGRLNVATPVHTHSVRAECRECSHCGHVGINDLSDSESACSACDWSGPSPAQDQCPDCGADGTMSAACPKCGSRYALIAEAHIETVTGAA